MGLVKLDSSKVFRQGPLGLIGDKRKGSDGVIPLAKEDDLEFAGGELDGLMLVNQMEDCTGDCEVSLLNGFGRGGW
ncbi:Hypothetical predicted protein [Olea europaea subsp. europaea]|uniref:Uncharacterized protein n=1 Tax=Olea europaea subsp. europaea TaxID=158383 RepID=A0A8S0RUY9_OLEEU|nr:Hypothetical predicted protein [Olea europaea subsp. europaea]